MTEIIELAAKRLCLASSKGDDRVAAISWGLHRDAWRAQARAAFAVLHPDNEAVMAAIETEMPYYSDGSVQEFLRALQARLDKERP